MDWGRPRSLIGDNKISKELAEMVSFDYYSMLLMKWDSFLKVFKVDELTSIFNLFHCSLRLGNMAFCKMLGTCQGEREMLFDTANTKWTLPYISRIP